MEPALQQETEKLTRSWTRHDPALLREYLVAGVEDPRLNVQSILTRHFLAGAVLGDRFRELMDQELRFAVVMNWLRELLGKIADPEEARAVLHGLRHGADDAEGIEIPPFVARIFVSLPIVANGLSVPNYIEWCLVGELGENERKPAFERALAVFQSLWNEALANELRPQSALTVLEAACGSANDYRFLDAYGLARLMDYTGFDLCAANVQNARILFPAACFETGNIFAIDAPDKSFDLLFAHDLFEHLSLPGLEAAVSEVCRVTRRGMCLGFFNMAEIASHAVQPVEEYHWNTLSMARMRESFVARGFETQVVHIGSFLRWAASCDRTHNPHAYTFLLRA